MSALTCGEQEHRRAMARRILALDTANLAIQAELQALHTPQCLAMAAREGILIVSAESAAQAVRPLVERLQQQGLDAFQDFVSDSSPYTHTNLSHVGVVVLICAHRDRAESRLHECYERAMALGKVIVPVMYCDDTLPDLWFDIQPLCVEDDFTTLAKPLASMFTAASM